MPLTDRDAALILALDELEANPTRRGQARMERDQLRQEYTEALLTIFETIAEHPALGRACVAARIFSADDIALLRVEAEQLYPRLPGNSQNPRLAHGRPPRTPGSHDSRTARHRPTVSGLRAC